MLFRLPRWNLGYPAFEVRDGSSREIRGRISAAFKTWLDLAFGKIEEQEERQDAIDTELQETVATLEVTVDAVEALANDTATIAGQVAALAAYLEPIVADHEARIDDIEARLAAAGIP